MSADGGAIVVVPFPFADGPVAKRRPAVVLSRRADNETYGVTTVAMVTTAKQTRWAADVPISDWAGAGLRQPCVVRPRLGTIENAFIERVIGTLSDPDRAALRESIERLFGWR